MSASLSKTKLVARTFGGSVSTYPPVFSADERYLFCCSGNDVKVVSLTTSESVRLLQAHTDTVTALAANPNNSLQLFSGSLDGTIRLWDFSDGIVLHTYEVNVPVRHMVVLSSGDSIIFAATNSNKGGDVFQMALRPPSPPQLLSRMDQVAGLSVGPRNRCIVAISGKNLYVQQLGKDNEEDDEDHSMRVYHFANTLTAVAVNEEAGCVAVGDISGVITLSYCLIHQNRDIPMNTTLHWHAHRVCALAFSLNGSYLLSGGLEAVLVIWQLGTRQKDFLPRLGSVITSVAVSPQNSFYCAGHDDSSLHVVHALNLRIKTTIQGVKLVGLTGTTSAMKTGLVFDPRHDALVLNSSPGCLQFYHPVLDRHLNEIEVVPRNRINRTDKSKVGTVVIDQVTFSPNGSWMVTVDRMEDAETATSDDISLKFWRFDDSSQLYVCVYVYVCCICL